MSFEEKTALLSNDGWNSDPENRLAVIEARLDALTEQLEKKSSNEGTGAAFYAFLAVIVVSFGGYMTFLELNKTGKLAI
ncbi:hypothetical protein CJU90_4350 [Yarrowia sp. C11]|nr:hypothetical protein CJU90_4350 [Yarrowia sp. C11]